MCSYFVRGMCQALRDDWQLHPWLRAIVCGAGGALSAVSLLLALFGLLLTGPGPATQGALDFATAAFLAGATAACWRGGTRAWADLGHPAPSPRTRQMVYAGMAVPAVVALPGALLGAGYLQSWLGLALAGAGGWAWWRYGGQRVAPSAPETAPAPVDQTPQSPGSERLH